MLCSIINSTCKDGKFQDCDFASLPNYEILESSCSDSLDNDCDSKIDLDDTNCKSNKTSQKCSDGTKVGACSGSRLCTSDLNLEYKCEVCGGCIYGKETCLNGACEPIAEKPEDICDNDGYCEADTGETETNCQNDCKVTTQQGPICGDRTCSIGEDSGTCIKDCPKSKAFLYIILFMAFILLLGLSFYFYRKKKKKPDERKEMSAFKPSLTFKPVLKQSEIKEIERPQAKLESIHKSNITQLQDYIKRSLEHGKKPDEIKALSLKAGWSESEVDSAIRSARPEISKKDALLQM